MYSRVHFSRAGLALAVTAIAVMAPCSAFALSIDVNCNGMKVGAISVDSNGSGISGGFTSTVGGPPATLGAAAQACGEDHFNWYQVRVGGGEPPPAANGVKPTIPFVDPPPGGWNYGWADNLPWYWDEYGPKDGKNPDGTAYDNGYLLKNQVTKDTLKFSDYPAGSDKVFNTWLVSLNADGSFHDWHEGFSWEYSKTNNTVSNIKALTASPTDAQYKNIIGGFASSVPEPWSASLALVGLMTLMRKPRLS